VFKDDDAMTSGTFRQTL